MYQRFGLVSVIISATCRSLTADAEHERDGHADHLIGEKKEDCRGRRKHKHHRGGDPSFLARGPSDLVGLLTHLLHELEWVQLRHVRSLPCRSPRPNGYAPPNLEGRPNESFLGVRSPRKSVTGPLAMEASYCPPKGTSTGRRRGGRS